MDERTRQWVEFENLVIDPDQVCASLCVHEKLPSLKGHFPGRPVLPAVTIIDISLELLSHCLGSMDFTKVAVEKSKFTAIIEPGAKVDLKAKRSQSKTWLIEWRSRKDQSPMAKIQIVI